MNMKYLLSIIILVILFCTSINAQKRNRNRGRKPKGNCHLKKLDECFHHLHQYSNNTINISALLTTDSGINEICSNSLDITTCFSNYMTKCSTPLQREIFNFGLEQIKKYIERFCIQGEHRKNFLVHSKCIQEKVLLKRHYKSKCVDEFVSTVEKTKQFKTLDDKVDGICCSFNRWQKCMNVLIVKQCNNEAKDAMNAFLDGNFGGLIELICPKNVFTINSELCTSKYAEPGVKVSIKTSDNPIIKLAAKHFDFLFD